MSGTRSSIGPIAVVAVLALPGLGVVDLAAQDLMMSNGAEWNTCTGTFYDSGGSSGNYGNSQNFTAVLCPGGGNGSGAATTVHFLSFTVGSLLDPGDQLVVHDGTNTGAAIMATGTTSNSLAGQTFTATGPSGCLTFRWTSSLLGSAAGWSAEILTGPDAGANASLTLCGAQPPFLLYDALGGDPDVGGFWSGPQGPHGPQYDPNTDPGGAYVYTVIDGSLCRDSALVSITNVAPPDPGEDGELLICNASAPVQLLGSLGGTPNLGGTWTGPGGADDGSFDPTTDAEGLYTYTVGGNAPCPNATATVNVAVTDQPHAGTNGNLSACDTVVALALFDGLGGAPDIGGTWTDLDGTGALNNGILNTDGLSAGHYSFAYSVAVTGCGSDTALVDVQVVGGVHVNGVNRSCLVATRTSIITFTITGGDPDNYMVSGVPGTLTASAPFIFTSESLPDSMDHTVVVSDANGCGSVTLQFEPCTYPPHIYIPESFSPNGDGINDTFEIPGLQDFPGNEMSIFNRWGAPVYQVTDYHQGSKPWKGSVDNTGVHELVPTGTYYYVLDLNNGSAALRGFIYMNRGDLR